MPAEAAAYLSRVEFADVDVRRYEALMGKLDDGTLTAAERADLDRLLLLNEFVMLLRAKANAALQA